MLSVFVTSINFKILDQSKAIAVKISKLNFSCIDQSYNKLKDKHGTFIRWLLIKLCAKTKPDEAMEILVQLYDRKLYCLTLL